jgi:hypothetical protein
MFPLTLDQYSRLTVGVTTATKLTKPTKKTQPFGFVIFVILVCFV